MRAGRPPNSLAARLGAALARLAFSCPAASAVKPTNAEIFTVSNKVKTPGRLRGLLNRLAGSRGRMKGTADLSMTAQHFSSCETGAGAGAWQEDSGYSSGELDTSGDTTLEIPTPVTEEQDPPATARPAPILSSQGRGRGGTQKVVRLLLPEEGKRAELARQVREVEAASRVELHSQFPQLSGAVELLFCPAPTSWLGSAEAGKLATSLTQLHALLHSPALLQLQHTELILLLIVR